MKPILKITSLLIKAPLPCRALELYTSFKKRKERYMAPKGDTELVLSSCGLEVVMPYSCEPVVTGQLEMSYYLHPCGCIEKIRLPVKTAFLTTLTRTKLGGYKLSWSVSLS